MARGPVFACPDMPGSPANHHPRQRTWTPCTLPTPRRPPRHRLDGCLARGLWIDFYDPDGVRYGLPTYPYHCAPDGLLTIRQLRDKGLRPGGQAIAAQILWRRR